jgi:hypothetical protein
MGALTLFCASGIYNICLSATSKIAGFGNAQK